jgi:hypothetical protein
MDILEQILDRYPDEDFIKADGLDDAVIGLDQSTFRLIYSLTKVIELLEGRGMTHEEAEEFYYVNIEGAYIGDKTPIWCEDDFL